MAELVELRNTIISLKCCLCENLLTVPPIMVLSEDGKQLKCGRCKNNNDRPSICRNFAFENVAMFSSVPCMYKDCSKIMPWKEVERHEDDCDKKTIKCPIYNEKCDGIIQVRDVDSHCHRFHNDKIFHNISNFVFPFLAPSVVCFLTFNGLGYRPQNFVVMIMNTPYSNLSNVYVASFEEIDGNFTYDLKLSCANNNTSFTYENQTISKYDEKNHCLRCMNGGCDLTFYPHTRIQHDIPVYNHFKTIDLTLMEPLFGDYFKIRYTITIVPKKKMIPLWDTATGISLRNDMNANDECLKKQLRCPICMEYMISKIYNCENGHVLCDACKLRLTECPSCRTKLGGLRNFPLENLADELVLACIFSKNGCAFTGRLELLSQHEKECEHEGE
ncbi:unnamed protein product [Phaedon cochleariae]|uniref:E3 ubiquitin-protein ligase Sina-like RING finger domain-containing protein n=1 Tax=Phaedon cochleariae TaxID=80249 RepID=A0A9N9WZT6_PHACE|nr:unnamed protein product [Phaedon cochleariae]